MKIIEKFIEENAITKNNIILFSKENAITFIQLCESNNVKIFGIDSFYFFDEKIQPNLENSVDFSSAYYKQKGETIFVDAKEFIISKDDNLFFEITFNSSVSHP